MKYLLMALGILYSTAVLGQMPNFLEGTWKMEKKEVYEHWDKLNDTTLKGISYQLNEGRMSISEYLQIRVKENIPIYTATVVGQNQGRGIDFKLTRTEDSYRFENLEHDFPKIITYRKLSDTEMFVQVSDGGSRGFSYKMTRQYVKDTSSANPNYNKELAEKLGGDHYGMKSYFLVMLKTGTNTTADKELIGSSFRGHLENINRLVNESKMVVAGPLGTNDKKYRGIFILNNVKTAEEAKVLLDTDPAIKNKLLDYEIYPWYGSAALPEYLPYSDKIWKAQP